MFEMSNPNLYFSLRIHVLICLLYFRINVLTLFSWSSLIIELFSDEFFFLLWMQRSWHWCMHSHFKSRIMHCCGFIGEYTSLFRCFHSSSRGGNLFLCFLPSYLLYFWCSIIIYVMLPFHDICCHFLLLNIQ